MFRKILTMLFCSHPIKEWSEGGCRYHPGAPSALTQIVPYLSSLYTGIHSLIFNSVQYIDLCFIGSRVCWSTLLNGRLAYLKVLC